jgi:aspartate aminotransferase
VIGDAAGFVMHLPQSSEVAVIQGAAFGSSPAFRLSFATSYEQLDNDQAMDD